MSRLKEWRTRPARPAIDRRNGARNFRLGFNEYTLALFGAAVIVIGASLWAPFGPLAEKSDFTIIYLGPRMLYQGEAQKLYDLNEQERVRTFLFPQMYPLNYQHPPFEALLLVLLAALPYRTAYLIWGMTNALIWLVLIHLFRSEVSFPKNGLGYVVLWLLFAPLGVTLYQGQLSLVVSLMFALTFICLKRRQDLRAGAYLGFALFKFQFVLPFALIFLLRRKWRFLGGFLLSATVLGALSFVAVGWRGVLSYARLILNVSQSPASLSYGSAVDMGTLRGFVYALFGHRLGGTSLNFIVAAASLALVLFTAWRWRQEDRRTADGSLDLMFAGALAVSLMTGFYMFTHDFSPLILALFLVASHFPGPERRGLRVAVGTTLALFWIPPLYFALVAWHCLYLMFPILLVFGLSALRLARSSAEGMFVKGERERALA